MNPKILSPQNLMMRFVVTFVVVLITSLLKIGFVDMKIAMLFAFCLIETVVFSIFMMIFYMIMIQWLLGKENISLILAIIYEMSHIIISLIVFSALSAFFKQNLHIATWIVMELVVSGINRRGLVMGDNKGKSINVKALMKHFELTQVTGDSDALKRLIHTAEISRPGFELAGFFKHSDMRRLVIFGEKEIAFINQLDKKIQAERFDGLTHETTPAIIICKKFDCPEVLKEIAEKKNFPIFLTDRPTGRVSIAISQYLDEKLAEETTMHGVFMSIYGKGVIIRGDSGIGKSEIALELIKRGHLLVADDCVELYHIGNNIVGKSPEVLVNLLEIRGIGVVDVAKMFGVGSILDKDVVDLIVHLERWVPSKEYTRIGTEEVNVSEDILGIPVPKVIVPVTGGRSMAAVIEAAVMNMRLKEMGHDSSKEFVNRILANIDKNRNDE